MVDRRDGIMRHFPALLGRWAGGHARLWTLSITHPTLTVLLWREDQQGCLTIDCIGPDRIEAPIAWSNAQVEVVKSAELFDLTDGAASVRISECHVEVKEFPKRPWD